MKQKASTTDSRRGLRPLLWGRRSIAQRVLIISLATWLLLYMQAFAIAQWYIQKHKNEPLSVGVTFIPEYADYYGLDPKETMRAIRDDLGFRRFRLVSYWKSIEKEPGKYDFSQLDWQMDMVEEVQGSFALAIGLRQPRWPECHFPDWAHDLPKQQMESRLDSFIAATVDHVKNRQGLHSYQLENEFFLSVFGECPKGERTRLQAEFDLVKRHDPHHPIILSLANNYFGIPIGQPRADQFGVSVYKRVWDQTATQRYFEYPFTPTYYAWRAGLTEIFTGRDSMLHELQAEPWPPKDVGVKNASIDEQNKSMDVERLRDRIRYGKATGFRDMDLWGAEWWYWRKMKLGDPSLWEAVRAGLAETYRPEK